MFNKKFSSNIRRKRRMIISSLILFVVLLGLGYATFTTNLSLGGNLTIGKYDRTIYGVLAKEAQKNNGLARTYTGSHQDSMAGTGDKAIYYWYASNDNEGEAIQDKNNVLFAGKCWQIIRTTDTGGVKLLYNGEADADQCSNSGRFSHDGYNGSVVITLSTSYYYGTNYIYDNENDEFSLSGTVSSGTITPGSYTCASTNQTDTCQQLYFVESVNNGSDYNVLVIDGGANYSEIGSAPFNINAGTLADVGYMHNARYTVGAQAMIVSLDVLTATELSADYWYADSMDYGTTVQDNYSLINPYQVTSSQYATLKGKYTLMSDDQNAADTKIYYIAAIDNGNMLLIEITGGHDLNYFNSSYTYGSTYSDNGNGTYTIGSSNTVTRTTWYENHSSLDGKYVCVNSTSNTCSDIKYVTSTTVTKLNYEEVTHNYKYAKGYTYENGLYKLTNSPVSFWDITNSTNLSSLNNAHYTCFNSSGECSQVAYIFRYGDENILYYITLTNNESVNSAITNMLSVDNVNTNSSTIKKAIDAWYAKNMTSYSSYI